MSAKSVGKPTFHLLGMRVSNPIASQVASKIPRNRYRRQRWYLTALRTITQLGFFGFIAYVATAHQLAPAGIDRPPSVEAFCPFGGLESLITFATTGQMVQRTFTSTLVVFAALVGLTLVAGPAFCGWICPFGAIQEWLQRLGRAILKRRYVLPRAVDRPLRYLRYVLLVYLVVGTAYYGFLIFRDYDPFLAFAHVMSAELFAEGIKFGFVALIATLVLSLFVERPFCKYFCPLGGFVDLVSKVSLLQIARKPSLCAVDGACDKSCPVDIEVSQSKGTPMGCIGCLQCVASCPHPGALPLSLESLKAKFPTPSVRVARPSPSRVTVTVEEVIR
jgi:polyferredoxin